MGAAGAPRGTALSPRNFFLFPEHVATDTPTLVQVLDALPAPLRGEVVRELCSGRRLADVIVARQKAVAAAQVPRTTIEGLGQHVLTLAPEAYHYWNKRAPGCWRDKKFRREFARDNPEARVPYQPKTATIIRP